MWHGPENNDVHESHPELRIILPEFPHTPHLPWKPNPAKGDLVAESHELKLLDAGDGYVEEKIDGASVGINTYGGVPVRRVSTILVADGTNDLDRVRLDPLVCERADGRLSGSLDIDLLASNVDFIAQADMPVARRGRRAGPRRSPTGRLPASTTS